MTGARVVMVLIALALAAGCRERGPDDTPAWLGERIEAVLAEPVTNPPTRIFRFRYRGEVVYYRPPRCCDIQGEVRDAAGQLLCHPDGGFTGQGDGRCPDFATTRRDCAIVWTDPRAKAATLPGCPATTGLPES